MEKPQSSQSRSSYQANAVPSRTVWQSMSAIMFAPTMWILGVMTFAYFYLMSTSAQSPDNQGDLLRMVVNEILNVIAPSLTLGSFSG